MAVLMLTLFIYLFIYCRKGFLKLFNDQPGISEILTKNGFILVMINVQQTEMLLGLVEPDFSYMSIITSCVIR